MGPVLELPERRWTPRFELGIGADFAAVPLSLELLLVTHFPMTVGQSPNRVKRWRSQGMLRVGFLSPSTSGFGFRPWFGGGVTVTELEALDLSARSSVVTYSPTFDAGLEIAWQLGGRWSLRQDTLCNLFWRRDNYHVAPDGEIGRGPRVSCGAVIGIGVFFSRANGTLPRKK